MRFNIHFILILMVSSAILGLNISSGSVNDDIVCRWKITNWNDEILVYWYPIGYINASTNSYLNYTISNYNSTNINSPSSGTINIGNFSESITNKDAATNLTLSVWGWFPGLVTFTNWTLHEKLATTAADGLYTKGTISIEETTYTFGELKRKAITFEYQQDNTLGNQNTTLIYDYETGVLLSANTEITFLVEYYLELELVQSNLIASENLTSGFMIPLVLTTLLVCILKSNKKRN